MMKKKKKIMGVSMAEPITEKFTRNEDAHIHNPNRPSSNYHPNCE
jgi:hypothetical protein